MINLINISKSFRGQPALTNVSYNFLEGDIVGILGPHSCGKTTLLKILAGLLKSDSGDYLINEDRFKPKHLQSIGYLPEEKGLYPNATVLEMIIYVAGLRGISKYDARVEAIRFLDRFQIIETSKLRINQLERQDQQKIEIIAALIHKPDIIIFDEPFKGLDFNNQNIVWNVLDSLRQKGKTIILGSHNLELIQSLCNKIILMYEGQIVLSGDAKHILYNYSDDFICLEFDEGEDYQTVLNGLEEVKNFHRSGDEVHVYLNEGQNKKDFLHRISKDLMIYRYQIFKPTLRELFSKAIPQKEYSEETVINEEIF